MVFFLFSAKYVMDFMVCQVEKQVLLLQCFSYFISHWGIDVFWDKESQHDVNQRISLWIAETNLYVDRQGEQIEKCYSDSVVVQKLERRIVF